MKEILIRQYINGDTAISYEAGIKCKEDIDNALNKGQKIIMNFSGISYIITAFLNPVIGDLILERGEDVMKQIGIKNANPSIINKIKRVKDGAIIKREDVEEWFF